MKILLFSPYAAIWQHAFPEAVIAEALQQGGHSIYYATCHYLFQDGCVAMDAVGKNFSSSLKERSLICKRCTMHRELILKNFPFQEISLNQLLTTEDKVHVEKTISALTKKNWLDFIYDELPIGKISLNILLLKYKKINFCFNDHEWKDYLIEVKHSLYSLIAGRKLLKKLLPDRIIIYNTQYPTNQVISQLGRKSNTPVYYLHAGPNLVNRLNTLYIGHSSMRLIMETLFEQWKKKYRDTACSLKSVDYVTQHYIKLLEAKNFLVYSAPARPNKNIYKFFSIKPDQKIIVCAMSSYDELFAAQELGTISSETVLLFPSQIEWIQEIIQFIKQHPKLFLIIRVHPREFPNKRDSVKSNHAALLENIFIDLPDNVKVNWPSDNLSIYDLATCMRLCLNFISTVGKELVLFGIPVITYAPQEILFYPIDLNHTVKTKKEYYQAILFHVNQAPDFEKIRLLYRWYALEFVYAQLDLSDSIQLKECETPPIWERIKNKAQRTLNPLFKQERDCKKRSPALKERHLALKIIENNYPTLLDCYVNPSHNNLEEETAWIQQSITKIMRALCGHGHG